MTRARTRLSRCSLQRVGAHAAVQRRRKAGTTSASRSHLWTAWRDADSLGARARAGSKDERRQAVAGLRHQKRAAPCRRSQAEVRHDGGATSEGNPARRASASRSNTTELLIDKERVPMPLDTLLSHSVDNCGEPFRSRRRRPPPVARPTTTTGAPTTLQGVRPAR